MLILRLRPYNITQELSHGILTTIYIPNNVVVDKAEDEIIEVFLIHESTHPDALLLTN